MHFLDPDLDAFSPPPLLLYKVPGMSTRTRAGMHSQTLFLKSNRLWGCYWIFSTQCFQVLRRLLRQFNKNRRLFSEITPLN
jgi:hypothetical protein